MTKFSNKFQKPYFWPIFSIFGANFFSSKNPALSHATPHGSLNHAEFQKKLMNQSQEKILTEGQKNRT